MVLQVLSAFESDAAMKKAETRGAAFSLLLCITSRHGQQGQLEQLAEGLMAAARRCCSALTMAHWTACCMAIVLQTTVTHVLFCAGMSMWLT
jgi:hypothetical protein